MGRGAEGRRGASLSLRPLCSDTRLEPFCSVLGVERGAPADLAVKLRELLPPDDSRACERLDRVRQVPGGGTRVSTVGTRRVDVLFFFCVCRRWCLLT